MPQTVQMIVLHMFEAQNHSNVIQIITPLDSDRVTIAGVGLRFISSITGGSPATRLVLGLQIFMLDDPLVHIHSLKCINTECVKDYYNKHTFRHGVLSPSCVCSQRQRNRPGLAKSLSIPIFISGYQINAFSAHWHALRRFQRNRGPISHRAMETESTVHEARWSWDIRGWCVCVCVCVNRVFEVLWASRTLREVFSTPWERRFHAAN